MTHYNPDDSFAPPTSVRPVAPPIPVKRRGVRIVALVLATLWLLASVAAGITVYLGANDLKPEVPGGTGTVNLGVKAEQVSASSTHTLYGGDAYTGIQNAASDTEHTVADGANALGATVVAAADANATFARDLQTSSASFDADAIRLVSGALAVLIVGVGVANFCSTLQRSFGQVA